MASIICTVRPSRLPIYWSRKCIPLELKASCDLVEQEFETIFVQDHLPQLHLSIILGLPLDDDLKLDCGHIIGYHITFSWFLGIFVSHPICYHVGFYMFDFHLHFISDSWLRQFYHLIYTLIYKRPLAASITYARRLSLPIFSLGRSVFLILYMQLYHRYHCYQS